jgi:hypothetical protein
MIDVDRRLEPAVSQAKRSPWSLPPTSPEPLRSTCLRIAAYSRRVLTHTRGLHTMHPVAHSNLPLVVSHMFCGIKAEGSSTSDDPATAWLGSLPSIGTVLSGIDGEMFNSGTKSDRPTEQSAHFDHVVLFNLLAAPSLLFLSTTASCNPLWSCTKSTLSLRTLEGGPIGSLLFGLDTRVRWNRLHASAATVTCSTIGLFSSRRRTRAPSYDLSRPVRSCRDVRVQVKSALVAFVS